MAQSSQRVALLGATDRPGRYAYLAANMLRGAGHQVFPVSPRLTQIEGAPVYGSLADVRQPIDTVTVYVGPEISTRLEADLLAAAPRRVIFNPGAENPALAAKLTQRGIEVVDACTLVLLRTDQF